MSVFLHGEVTEQVLGAAFEVWKILGMDFWKKCTRMRLWWNSNCVV